MPGALTFKINPDLTTFTPSTSTAMTGLPASALAPSCLSLTVSQNWPIKMKSDHVFPAHNAPLVPISLRGKAEVLTMAYKTPHNPCGPYVTPWSLISPAICLPNSSRHMSLLKFLEQAGNSTPGHLHCCLLLLECSPSREPLRWLPHTLKIFTGYPV